jgi:SAM-dependent methyltransferase
MTTENVILSRFNLATPEIKLKVTAAIAQKTVPRFACLELGPGDGQWTEYLVAADPLYLADINQDFLDSTVKKFPEPYRPRIRTYLLNNDGNLSKLPQKQFGFVFAWDVFSFMPLDLCKEYLQNIFNILKPGGTFLFNYNNCDEYQNVRYVEAGFKSWMTKSLLEKTVKELGFDIEKYDNHEKEYWIIIRKPGNLRTVKSMQALGKIVQF